MSRRGLRAAARELARQGEDAETVIAALAPRCPVALLGALPRIADVAVHSEASRVRPGAAH